MAAVVEKRRLPESAATVWQAVLAWFALPGMVAYAVPVGWQFWRGKGTEVNVVGLLVVLAGSVALIHCARRLFSEGRGTLAPWRPPSQLVSGGLYRFSRNPMYLGVLVVLLGWSVAYQSPLLLLYTYLVGIGFQLRIIFSEEPWQARQFGADWARYAAHVPRWFAMSPGSVGRTQAIGHAARTHWHAHAAYALAAGLVWHGLTWFLAATLTPHYEAWDLPGLAPLLLPFLAGIGSGALCRTHLIAQTAGAFVAPVVFLAVTRNPMLTTPVQFLAIANGLDPLLLATLFYSAIPAGYFFAGAGLTQWVLLPLANIRKRRHASD